MSIETDYVLVLNNAWIPIGVKRIKEAISAVYENVDWQIIQIDYIDNEPFIHPLSWKEWVTLDVPVYCKGIKTIHGQIRQPTVIISKNFSKTIYRTLKPTKRGIFSRDKGICQYSGKKLNKNNWSVDHLIPRSRGGANTWDNMVLCDKSLNNKKGSMLPHEAGLKLIKDPKSPEPTRVNELITTKHRDWEYFIA